MIIYIFLIFVGFNNNFINATIQCSCILGYRNGAQSTDINLCMGPSEGGKRPCYPTPCNSDWTACTTQTDDTIPGKNDVWVKDSDNTGKRPDCTYVKINKNGANYMWNTLEKCKDKCISEPTGKCNMVSRFGETYKTSSELYHCRFYACENPLNFQWVTQAQWGNGASTSNTYIMPIRHHITLQNIVNKTNWINKTIWNNVTRWVDKTRWLNKTRLVDKTRWLNKTRLVDKTRWLNKTRWVDKTRWLNKTRLVNKTRWNDKTNIIDKSILTNTDDNTFEDRISNINSTKSYNCNTNLLSVREIYFISVIILLFICCILCIFREFYKVYYYKDHNNKRLSYELQNIITPIVTVEAQK